MVSIETVSRTSMQVDDYEATLIFLDHFTRTARLAIRRATSLEEKVRFSRVERAMEEARSSLLNNVFEYQDANRIACHDSEFPEP